MRVSLGSSCEWYDAWKPRCQAHAAMEAGRGAVDVTNKTVSVAMDGVRGAGGVAMDVFRSGRDLFVSTSGGIVNSTVSKPLATMFADPDKAGANRGTGIMDKTFEVGGVAYPALPLYVVGAGLLLMGAMAMKKKRRR